MMCIARDHAQEGRVRARLLCRLWMSWGLLGDAFKELCFVLFGTHCDRVKEPL